MRQKLLLAMLVLSSGLLMAQDTIKTLVITEAKMDRAEQAYAEITNMGDVALNLKDFEFGMLTPWNAPLEGLVWPEGAPQVDNQAIERLPDLVLEPGESYVIGAVSDYVEEAYARDVARFGYSEDWGVQFLTNPKMWDLINLPVHRSESPIGDPTDSISRSDDPLQNYESAMETWGGRDVFYIRHHISPTDSAIVDQVGGLFNDESGDGTNPNGGNVDVAGVEGATGTHYLMRRFDVKQGNTEFVRGVGLDDSEWIPVPFMGDNQYNERQRGPFWTVGNHVNAVLDETTLTSSTLEVDWTTNTISVPWGVRNDDSIMFQFDYTPGLAWHYDYSPVHEDSAYVSVQNGDTLTIFALGNTLQTEVFGIVVMEATADANIVVPMKALTDDDDYVNAGAVYEVTDGLAMDTISEIPFACRVDSLLKYLEKAPKANWGFVWVDGNERTDLLNGDLLKVTSEDGTAKDYYLKLQKYRKGRNTDLSSITWPDIPEFYKGIFGWMGDTIPNFSSAVQNYVVQVPADVDGIPALVAKTDDANAKLEMQRAVNLFGSVADKTVTFTVTAENDTVFKEYAIQLEKEKLDENLQPWLGEPFFSQIIWQDQWANAFMEIVNPGTEAIDMSDYMLYFGDVDNWVTAIQGSSGVDDYDYRYHKYIPGRIWPDTAAWQADPGKVITDLNVSTIVHPGDVFVLSDIHSTGQAYSGGGFGEGNWPAENQSDVHFTKNCPWESVPNASTALRQWNTHYFLFKMVGEGGDSVKNGLKAATDPDDFVLLDVWGAEGVGATHVIGGETMVQTSGYARKPDVFQGTTVLGESFGTDMDNSQWIRTNRPYFQSLGVGWPMDILRITDGIGSHFMDEVTTYRSTVASLTYKVSLGYSMEEEIRGATTGTDVDGFIANLIPADSLQTLMVKSAGVEIVGDAVLTHGDSLVVMSADSSNTSKYFIEITDDGLSDDAVLTSDTYTIVTDPASVSGFEMGTLLRDVVEGVVVPDGAMMNVIDENSASVPLLTINFDTMYVDVVATDQVYFEVVAEDGATTLVYQLMPDSDPSDAYVTSSAFEVDQDALLIKLVPEGTTVSAFLNNLVPATGATWVLLDKLGYERTDGVVVQDDKLVVTAADGETSVTYFLALLEEVPSFYHSYVVSSVYLVNQNLFTITGVMGSESVTDFSANVTPAEGASIEVQNTSGAAKGDSDMMEEADMLQVTAGNGVNVTTYVISLDYTGIDDLGDAGVNIYPNPSNGLVNIAGAEIGSRIRVYNAGGVNVSDIVVYSGVESISLEDQPAGMFFITISNADEVTGHYKVIKH